jgi:hypothetical protein
MTALTKHSLAATVAVLAACASPDGGGPTAPAPASMPTPRPAPSPALLVTTAPRSSAGAPSPAQVATYAIGPDGRLTLAAPPQPLGAVDRVYAVSYVDSSGLYRQVLSEAPSSQGGPVSLVTHRVDLETGLLTRLGASELPFRSAVAAFHPGGRFLYATEGPQRLHGFELDPGNGAILRAVPGGPFTWDAPMGVSTLAFAESGRIAWAQGRIPDGYHSNRGFVLTFAFDPATGALSTSAETPVFDQFSDLAVATREDAAYVVDRTDMSPGELTWRRFSVDPAGALAQEARWNQRLGGIRMRFTRSDRFLVALEGDTLDLLEIGASGRPTRRAAVKVPWATYWDARRVIIQWGDFLYVGADNSLTVVRVDEAAGTLEKVQELTPGENLQVLAVALARPAS